MRPRDPAQGGVFSAQAAFALRAHRQYRIEALLAGDFAGTHSELYAAGADRRAAVRFVVLFQLITLPVEFNASGRALRILEERGILAGDELKGAERCRAAAMTYVASLFSSILQLLRLVLLTRRDNRRR